MESDCRCPFCHSLISTDDINVATDIALCRRCGRTSSFALVINQVSMDILKHPPRHIKTEIDASGGTVITYRKIPMSLLFLIPFTAVWSGGSMWGIYDSQIRRGSFNIGSSLFGLPFLAGTIVLLSIIIFGLFGKWKVMLKNGQGSIFAGVGPIGWRRSFTYNRNTVVALRMSGVEINSVPQKGIFVKNDASELLFGTSLSEAAKKYIAAAIMKAADRF